MPIETYLSVGGPDRVRHLRRVLEGPVSDDANPIAAILTGALMLEQLGHPQATGDLERAVREVVASGVRTPDLGGTATTAAAAAAIAARL